MPVHRLGCQADCGIELDVQQIVVLITVRSNESLPGSWQQRKELIGLLNGLTMVLKALCRRKRDRQAGAVPASYADDCYDDSVCSLTSQRPRVRSTWT